MIETGKYRHYKGLQYEVLGTAMHSETLELMVVYKPLYNTPDIPEGMLWVRPFDMFFENVEINNTMVPRFQKIED